MTSRAVRNFLFRLHAWVGLNLSIMLALMFATGTFLVFTIETEALLHEDMRVAARDPHNSATPGEIHDAVRSAYPNASVQWFEPQTASWIGDATAVRTNWDEYIYVWTDPVSAEVLGTTSRDIAATRFVRGFHDSLLTGHRLGYTLITATSLALLISIVTGLVTYRRFWRGFFRAPPRHLGPRGWWAGLHRLAALWSLPFLIVICLTGLYYFAGAIGVPTGNYPKAAEATERDRRLPPGFNGNDLDRAAAVATGILPDLHITRIVLPNRKTEGISFLGHTKAVLADERANSVVVDPVTFETLGVYQAGDLDPLTRITSMIEPLHYGLWGGFTSRLLWLVFGAVSTAGALFGVMVYAARVLPAPVDGAVKTGAFRRAWAGMNSTKWLVVLILAGAVAAGTYRFGPANDKWVGQWHPDPAYGAKLWTRGNLRSGEEIGLRFRVKAEGPLQAIVQLGDGPAINIMLEQDGGVLSSVTTLRADTSDNEVILTIPDLGDAGTILTWHLGRPIL